MILSQVLSTVLLVLQACACGYMYTHQVVNNNIIISVATNSPFCGWIVPRIPESRSNDYSTYIHVYRRYVPKQPNGFAKKKKNFFRCLFLTEAMKTATHISVYILVFLLARMVLNAIVRKWNQSTRIVQNNRHADNFYRAWRCRTVALVVLCVRICMLWGRWVWWIVVSFSKLEEESNCYGRNRNRKSTSTMQIFPLPLFTIVNLKHCDTLPFRGRRRHCKFMSCRLNT